MAVKSDIKTDLTLEITGRSVTPEKFIRSVRAFFAILKEVTGQVAGKEEAVQWVVQVSEGSNLVGVDPVPGFSPVVVSQIIKAVSDGIGSMENSAATPKFFSERAIRSLRELGEVTGANTNDDTTVRVWAKKQPFPVTHKSVAHVAELLESGHEDYGSIEGRLRTVSDKGGLHFVVKEPILGQEIRCFIPEGLIDTAVANFRQRVEVYGRIKYRKDGKAVSIYVDDIVPFPPKEALPSFREVRGILRGAH